MPLFTGQMVHKTVGCLTVDLKAIHSFETSITICQTTGRYITKGIFDDIAVRTSDLEINP